MKLQLITALALATLVVAPATVVTPASAGPLKDAWVRQEKSIINGVSNGTIRAGEAARLENREASIAHQAAVLRSTGGGLSPLEKFYLGTQLVGARGAIVYHKHN